MAKTKKNKGKNNLEASMPWFVMAKKLQKFLGADPEITVVIDKDEFSANIVTGNTIKADALFDLLRKGDITWEDGETLTIKINGSAKTYDTSYELKDFERAFSGNPYFSHIEKDNTDKYVMWKPIPIQVAVNNIQDLNGFEHEMPVDFVQRIFQAQFAYGTEPLEMIVGSFC